MTRSGQKQPGRDWIPLLLSLAITYLVLLLPIAALIGAKPEVMGGAIGALALTLGGIVGARAVGK